MVVEPIANRKGLVEEARLCMEKAANGVVEPIPTRPELPIWKLVALVLEPTNNDGVFPRLIALMEKSPQGEVVPIPTVEPKMAGPLTL